MNFINDDILDIFKSLHFNFVNKNDAFDGIFVKGSMRNFATRIKTVPIMLLSVVLIQLLIYG